MLEARLDCIDLEGDRPYLIGGLVYTAIGCICEPIGSRIVARWGHCESLCDLLPLPTTKGALRLSHPRVVGLVQFSLNAAVVTRALSIARPNARKEYNIILLLSPPTPRSFQSTGILSSSPLRSCWGSGALFSGVRLLPKMW